MTAYKLILTAGFAMFSMFFGSGNLVFPILVGVEAGQGFPLAAAGLSLTGVLVPFLGLLAMIVYQGKTQRFFHPLGKSITFVLSFCMLSLMGPFGVLPRCIIVAFGGFKLLYPQLPFVLFSFLFCALIGVLAWKKNRMIEILGNILTPVLVLSMIGLFLIGIWLPETALLKEQDAQQAFMLGIHQGYQTMDLIASFFFSATIISFLRHMTQSVRTHLSAERLCFGASLVGMFLLALVYLGFVFMGAKFAPLLHGVGPECLLIALAQHTLGSLAAPVGCLIIFLACLTTAVVLASLYADFMHHDLTRNKLAPHPALLTTLVLGFTISLLGFDTLAHFLAKILSFAYPALIVYTLMALAHKRIPTLNPAWGFWAMAFGIAGVELVRVFYP